MNVKFKKLALAAGITAALGGVSMPTHAIIQGAAGEALLVPFALWDTVGGVNTIVELTIPGSVGHDTIPNHYTASHTTPGSWALDVVNPALEPPFSNHGHWYFFNHKSGHEVDGPFPVSVDDWYLFNAKVEIGKLRPDLDGVKGYLIFTTSKASTHAAADFSFFGEAHLVFNQSSGVVNAELPVLPLNDGIDLPGQIWPTGDNQVIYDGNQIPMQASPLFSGMRTNWSDGKQNNTVWDLTLNNRNSPTLHVFWNDVNQGTQKPVGTSNFTPSGGDLAALNVYDTDEFPCSTSVPLPWELNVIWISTASQYSFAPKWVDNVTSYCFPNGPTDKTQGFVRYSLPEWIDTNINAPESAAVAFSITLTDPSSGGAGFLTPIITELGHERGKFQ